MPFECFADVKNEGNRYSSLGTLRIGAAENARTRKSIIRYGAGRSLMGECAHGLGGRRAGRR